VHFGGFQPKINHWPTFFLLLLGKAKRLYDAISLKFYRQGADFADCTVEVNKKWSIISTVLVLSAILSLAGCVESVRSPEIVFEPRSTPAIPSAEHRIVGTSVQGRPILCTVLGQGQDVTLILATIHGNEPAGTPLVQRLADYLQSRPNLLARRKVVLLPVANPDGMAYNSRYNAKGVDLNRNFATANWQNDPQHGYAPLSEPEARAIASVIQQYSPNRIVSIHQPLTCIDYDGPAWTLASHLAQHCDLPIRKLGAQPGSLGSYAGLTLQIPIITFELPRNADGLSEDSLWQRYGSALLAAVIYPEMAK
jgi:protein MpaA